jgi:hypothetical protein
MKEYGRTYDDEVEKARRFKIFKSVAKCADVADVEAAQAGIFNWLPLRGGEWQQICHP